MQPEAPAQKPRRERHLVRWIFIGILAILGWYGWKAYDFRQAVKEAKALGWQFYYKDPIALIRFHWINAFRKQTWDDRERNLSILTTDLSQHHFDVIRSLRPKSLSIWTPIPDTDLSQLKGLSNLTHLSLFGCPNLTNIDALKDMHSLESLAITDAPKLASIDGIKELKNLMYLDNSSCSALTNLDALRNLKALRRASLEYCRGLKNVDGLLGLTDLALLDLHGCQGLTKEALDPVKAALSKTMIQSPDSDYFTRGGRVLPHGGRVYSAGGTRLMYSLDGDDRDEK